MRASEEHKAFSPQQNPLPARFSRNMLNEALKDQVVNHCPLKEAAFANKFCSPIEGSQSLLDWASLGH